MQTVILKQNFLLLSNNLLLQLTQLTKWIENTSLSLFNKISMIKYKCYR